MSRNINSMRVVMAFIAESSSYTEQMIHAAIRLSEEYKDWDVEDRQEFIIDYFEEREWINYPEMYRFENGSVYKWNNEARAYIHYCTTETFNK